MKTPSVRALVAAFRDLTPAQAGLIKRIGNACDDAEALADLLDTEVQAPDCFGSDIRYSNRMWRRTYALRAINHILGTHGVEALSIEGDSGLGAPPYEYLNAGDTYATTLVYFRDSDTLRITCWGDVVEAAERRGVELR